MKRKRGRRRVAREKFTGRVFSNEILAPIGTGRSKWAF